MGGDHIVDTPTTTVTHQWTNCRNQSKHFAPITDAPRVRLLVTRLQLIFTDQAVTYDVGKALDYISIGGRAVNIHRAVIFDQETALALQQPRNPRRINGVYATLP